MFIYGASILDLTGDKNSDSLRLVKDNVSLSLSDVIAINRGSRQCISEKYKVDNCESSLLNGYSINNVVFHKTDLYIAQHLMTLGLSEKDFVLIYKDNQWLKYYKSNNTLMILEDILDTSRFGEFPIDKLLNHKLCKVLDINAISKDYRFNGDIIGLDSCGNEVRVLPSIPSNSLMITGLRGCNLGISITEDFYHTLIEKLR